MSTSKRDLSRRQIQNTIVLSLYENPFLAITSAPVPINPVFGYGMGGGAINVTSTLISSKSLPILNSASSSLSLSNHLMFCSFWEHTLTSLPATYIDVCNICPNGYRTLTTTATLQQCGCHAAAVGAMAITPIFPMAVVTKACSSCGVNGSPAVATVTVPCTTCGVVAAATGGPAVFAAAAATVTGTVKPANATRTGLVTVPISAATALGGAVNVVVMVVGLLCIALW
jgi:hypothetical protein